MSHTANMLNGHIDQTVVHMCAKTSPTAIATSQVLDMYVIQTNNSLKYHRSHMKISLHADMTQLCQCKWLI